MAEGGAKLDHQSLFRCLVSTHKASIIAIDKSKRLTVQRSVKNMIGKMGLFGVFLGGMSGRFGAVVGPRRVREVGITLPTGE